MRERKLEENEKKNDKEEGVEWKKKGRWGEKRNVRERESERKNRERS